MESARVCSTPYILNNLPDEQREFLMRKNIRDEISKFAGVDIGLRGRYIKPTKDGTIVQGNDLPLHLHIAGPSKNNVARAMKKIEFLLKTKNTNSKVVDTDDSSLMEKIYVGIDMFPSTFGMQLKLLGENDTNVKYIESETGAVISLQGKGSGDKKSIERLHFLVKYKKLENQVEARQLVLHLIKTVQQDFLKMYGTKFANPKKPEVVPVKPLQKNAITSPSPKEQDKVVADNLTTTFEKIVLGLDRVPSAFNLKHKIYGKNLTNVKHIEKTTGAKILLEGIGYDFDRDNESQGPPYILVKYLKPELKDTVRKLILNLISTIHEEFVTLYGIYLPKPRAPEIIPLKNLSSASNISAPSSTSNFSKSTAYSDQEKSSKLKVSRVVSKFTRRASSDESNERSPPPPPASSDFIGILSTFSSKPLSPPSNPIRSKHNAALRKLTNSKQLINSPSSITSLGTRLIAQEETVIKKERSPSVTGNEMESMYANRGGDGRHQSRRVQWRHGGRSQNPSDARQGESSDGCSQSQSRKNMERCYECHDNGHLARNCPNVGLIKCYTCKRFGNHISFQCPENNGDLGNQRLGGSSDILSENGRSWSRNDERHKTFNLERSQTGFKKGRRRCYVCHDYGHLAVDCFNTGLIKCYVCNRFGYHISTDCPENVNNQGSRKRGRSSDSWNQNETNRSRSSEREEDNNFKRSCSIVKMGRCYACHDNGHMAKDCPHVGLIKCYVCQRFGHHISTECPKKNILQGNQKGDSRKDKWKQDELSQGKSSAKKGALKKDKRRCFQCHDSGHIAVECPNEGLIKCYACKRLGNHISTQCPVNIDDFGS